MRLIFPFVITCKVSDQVVFQAIHILRVCWNFSSTIIDNEGLQLFYPVILDLHALFCISIDLIICFKLLLQLNNSFISFIESWSQCNHDVSLFEKKLFISVNLLLVFFNLDTFFFNFLHFNIVLLANKPLSFLKCWSELWSVFYLLSSNEHLTVHCLYFLLKYLLLLPLIEVFPASQLQSSNRSILVFLSSSFFLFKFENSLVAIDALVFLIQFNL